MGQNPSEGALEEMLKEAGISGRDFFKINVRLALIGQRVVDKL
jgi:hypothetical protein